MPFPVLHRLRWPLAPVLGGLATLGFAPYGQWYLSVLALALLMALASRAAPLRAAALGWLFGVAHFATGIYWVYISTHVYGGAPAWLAVLLLAALSAYLALYPALAMGLAARLGLLRGPADARLMSQKAPIDRAVATSPPISPPYQTATATTP
jgi:apolipoprotein N-acyltransferase